MTFGPGGMLWRTVCDIDARALPTQDMGGLGDGAVTYAGMTWALLNSGNATSFGNVNGTGLVIVCNTNSSSYTGGTRTSPMLILGMNAAFNFYNTKEYKPPSHMVRIMARVLLTSADADFENALLGVEDVTLPLHQSFALAKGRNGGDRFTSFACDASAQTTILTSSAAFTDDVMGLCWEAPDMMEYWSGIYDTAGDRLPDIFNSDRASYSSNLATPDMRLLTSPNIFLGAETVNLSGSLTVTFTHFRVDVGSKSPAR